MTVSFYMYINIGNIYMYIEREATVRTNNTNKSKIVALEKQNCKFTHTRNTCQQIPHLSQWSKRNKSYKTVQHIIKMWFSYRQ